MVKSRPSKIFKPRVGEIIVRDRFEVTSRPVAIGQIILAVDFKLALGVEGHAKAAAHGGALKLRVGAQRPHGADEKFSAAHPVSDRRPPSNPCARCRWRFRRSRSRAFI